MTSVIQDQAGLSVPDQAGASLVLDQLGLPVVVVGFSTGTRVTKLASSSASVS